MAKNRYFCVFCTNSDFSGEKLYCKFRKKTVRYTQFNGFDGDFIGTNCDFNRKFEPDNQNFLVNLITPNKNTTVKMTTENLQYFFNFMEKLSKLNKNINFEIKVSLIQEKV